MQLRAIELEGQLIETIYFGGGTPSLLTISEVDGILNEIGSNFIVGTDLEVTLEANPDDLSAHYIEDLSHSGVNRLSIGVQSFHDTDLQLMNRAHSTSEANTCLENVRKFFSNVSIDLIYGIPNTTNDQWMENINRALDYEIQHISAYALTVEPKTALKAFVDDGRVQLIGDDQVRQQFYLLIDRLNQADFIHYELSNFGRQGFFSKNNSAYWQGKHYIGLGPSAHSFNGFERSWNVSNNSLYIKALSDKSLPNKIEKLSEIDRYNECIMTGLRTIWGVSLDEIENKFGVNYKNYLLEQSADFIQQQLLYIENGKLVTTNKGKFLTDGIASNLFKLNN